MRQTTFIEAIQPERTVCIESLNKKFGDLFTMLLQAPAYEEDGGTIGMTTNSDVSKLSINLAKGQNRVSSFIQVKTYKSVEEVKGKVGQDSLRRNGSGKKVSYS